jgi:hypothetical protein
MSDEVMRALARMESKQDVAGDTLTGVRLDVESIKAAQERITGEFAGHVEDDLKLAETVTSGMTEIASLREAEQARAVRETEREKQAEAAAVHAKEWSTRKWTVALIIAGAFLSSIGANLYNLVVKGEVAEATGED